MAPAGREDWDPPRSPPVPASRRRRPPATTGAGVRSRGPRSFLGGCRRRCRRIVGVALGGLAVEELPDEVLKHDRRLGGCNRIAGREILLVGPCFDADVLFTQ